MVMASLLPAKQGYGLMSDLARARGYVQIIFTVRWPYERIMLHAWPLGGDRYRIQCPHPALDSEFNFVKLLEKHVVNLSLRRLPREGDIVSCRQDAKGNLFFVDYQDQT